MPIFTKSFVFPTQPPKHDFLGIFLQFSFVSFSSFLFVFPNTRKAQTKMPASFRKPHSWHSDNLQSTLLAALHTLSVTWNTPKKTIKLEKISKNILDQLLTFNLDQFWLMKRQILDQFLTLQRICICISVCMYDSLCVCVSVILRLSGCVRV